MFFDIYQVYIVLNSKEKNNTTHLIELYLFISIDKHCSYELLHQK